MATEGRPEPISPFDPANPPEPARIGINSVEWRRSNLEEVLERVHDYGIRYVELVARKNVFTDSLDKARSLLSERQIEPNAVSAFTKLNEAVHERVAETQDLINECIDIAAHLGAPYSLTYFGTNALLDDEEAISRYVEFIRPCVRHAEEKGVVLLIDNLFDAVPPEIPATFRQRYRSSDATRTARGCLRLLQSVDSPWFRLNYDPGNFLIGGEEAYPYAYELLKDYIGSIHLKDAVKFDQHLYRDYTGIDMQRDVMGDYMCVALGTGAVNYEALLGRLKRDGYHGSLILEPHTGLPRLNSAIRDSLQYLAQHGFPHGK
jgi:sugar phosphate isomerase/epimerase